MVCVGFVIAEGLFQTANQVIQPLLFRASFSENNASQTIVKKFVAAVVFQ